VRSVRTALLCAAMLMVASCADVTQTSPLLIQLGDTRGYGTGMQKSIPQQSYLFGGMPVCLHRRGAVLVKNVQFENPQGGIRLEGFALRPFYGPFGNDGIGDGEPITLQRKGIPAGPRMVTQVCQPLDSLKPQFSELVVQVSHFGDTTGFSPALIVTYTSSRHLRTLRMPIEFVFCGHKKDVARHCD
jgi:hypothetical protein